MIASGGRPRVLLAGLGLCAAVLAVYADVRTHGFENFDTPVYLTGNRMVLAGYTLAGVRWAFTTFATGNWHPLTWLSLMDDVTWFGLDPAAHHLASVALHAATSALLLAFLWRATGRLWPSLLAAALFALHPMHVEPVAWTAQRKDVLSTLFLVLTLLAYLHYVERPGRARLALVLGCFALGLLAKPMLVSVPFLLLALDDWPLARSGARRLVIEKAPFFALAAATAAVTLVAQHSAGAVGDLERFPVGLRFANAAVSVLVYLRKTAWPSDPAVFYPHPGSIPVWQWLGACVVLAAATAAAWHERARRPWLLVGWLWFGVALVPVIGIVQVGRQGLADRYSYVPHIGLFVAAAFSLDELVRARPAWRRPIAAAACGAVLALALACA